MVAAITLPARAVEPEVEAANAAVEYIISLQNDDGGFPAFGEESSPGATIDAVFALVAAGRDVESFAPAGRSPVEYLKEQAATYAEDPGAAAKLSIAVSAMGLEPSSFGGADLLAVAAESYDAETGVYGLDLFDEALYMMALVAAGEPVPETLFQHLRSRRATDGGWEFTLGSGSDTNTTAVVAQALVAAGAARDDHAVGAALNYIRVAQNDDGGFGFVPGADSDPNSTALAIQAIVAEGEDPDVGSRWEVGGQTPLATLASLQNPTTGAFQFDDTDSPFATYQAVPALMLAPLPDLEPRFGTGPAPTATQPAPTATEVLSTPGATATPVATATPGAPVLPSTGTGAGNGTGSGWPALLAVAGLLALAGGVAMRRSR